MANIGNIAATLSLNTRNWTNRLRGAERGLKGFVRRSGRSLIRFAKRAAFYMSIIAGVGLAGLITQFAKFEEAMRNVNTIAKQNEEQFLETSRAVVLMSREFGRMPIGLAEALYDINSASFTAARGLTVLRAATLAGRAGLSTTREAARAITGALNAYALSAEQARDISDTMFQTVKFGVLTFGDLAGSLGIAVSTAAAAKVPFDQLAAAAATMTRGGIQVREAFTALNRVMLRIIQNRGVLGKVFATTAEGSGAAMLKVRGLAGTMQFLQKITKGEANSMIALGFMVRDLKAALSLTRNEGKDYARDIARIADKNKRAGATMEAFKEQTKALSFQFALLRSAFMSLLIIIGRLIAPVFRMFLKDITNQINRLDDWVKSIRFTAEQWKGIYKSIRTFVLTWAARIQFGILMIQDVTKRVVNNIIVLFERLKTKLQPIFDFMKDFFKALTVAMTKSAMEGKTGVGQLIKDISSAFTVAQEMAIFKTAGRKTKSLFDKVFGTKEEAKGMVDLLGGIPGLLARQAARLKNISGWTGEAKKDLEAASRIRIGGVLRPNQAEMRRMGEEYSKQVARAQQQAATSPAALNVGAQTIERGTVEAFRAERGLDDPSTKAAEETSANTKAIEELMKIANDLAKNRKVVAL